MAGKILIVDDVATNRIVLKVKLSAACYVTLQAENGETALRMAKEEGPALILLDLLLPDIDGVTVCKRLKADPQTRDIPVVIVTSHSDFDTKIRALRAGADEYLSKPVDEQVLLARLRSLLRAREVAEELTARDATNQEFGFAESVVDFDAPGRVALIAARRETAMRWRHELAPLLPDQLSVMARDDALAGSESAVNADVFVISADLALRGDGLRLMSELRSRHGTRHAATCIVLPDPPDSTAAIALDLGANDLLPAGFDPREMALRIRTLLRRKRQSDRLRNSLQDGLRLATMDPLTGLYNRRYTLPHLARIAERARQSGRSYAVMVLDLDRFKSVNDTHGHAAGDTVLVEVARRLKDNLRSVDLLGRIGGEEFLIAMPDTSLGTARLAAERLCKVINSSPVALPASGQSITVTISIGLAVGGVDEVLDTSQSPFERADKALLAAKAEGRNQVTVGMAAA